MNVGFVKVARLSQIPEGRSRRVLVGTTEIALWHVNGRIYAINNVCAHQHIAALHQGTLEGTTIRCPMHGWTYALETGVAVDGSGRVRTYRVRVEGEDVLVEEPVSEW